jgi:hypothetical protein
MYALAKPHGIDTDIAYILVVGHFGLATGSGGKTQSNMHNKSQNWSLPADREWATQSRLEAHPSNSAQ